MVNLREEIFARRPRNDKFYIFAIDGHDGSGKTSLAKYLAALMSEFVFINGDDYWEPIQSEQAWGEFNEGRFQEDVVSPLKNGKAKLNYRPFDWDAEPNISERVITIDKGIFIERVKSFGLDLDYDYKIWVDTPSETCFERGVPRDGDGLPRERVERTWREVWMPDRAEYIERIKPLETADIIIDGTKPFASQLI